jgi:hypothetical protein
VVNKIQGHETGVGAIVYVLAALALLGAGIFGYVQYSASHQPQAIELTPEAKQYVRNLKLSDVGIKATESYVKQTVVEIVGNISNTGDRAVDTVELNCLFYDPNGQVVSRQRVPIVSSRSGGLKPGEAKPFRLPFDDLPESWNHQIPHLVIAGMRFAQ